MTARESSNWKINGAIDKVLFAILGFFAVQTYTTIKDAERSLQEIKTHEVVNEYRLLRIEKQLNLNQ